MEKAKRNKRKGKRKHENRIANHPALVEKSVGAHEAGVHPETWNKMIREGRAPRVVRFGGRAYHHRKELDSYFDSMFDLEA
jgi:hypothetical protein